MEHLYLFVTKKLNQTLVFAALLTGTMTTAAQALDKELQDDPNRSAGNFYALPIGKMPKDTPAPNGKKPKSTATGWSPSAAARSSACPPPRSSTPADASSRTSTATAGSTSTKTGASPP